MKNREYERGISVQIVSSRTREIRKTGKEAEGVQGRGNGYTEGPDG